MEEKDFNTILESLATVIRDCKLEISLMEFKIKDLEEKNKELREALKNAKNVQ